MSNGGKRDGPPQWIEMAFIDKVNNANYCTHMHGT